jgi:putative flippase GtrA
VANYTRSHMVDAVKTKGIRYSMVSVVNVIVGQGLLVVFATVLGWNLVLANVLAVCISAGPAYVLNRQWVWGKSGKNHLTKEVLPFWGFALAGLALSSLAVWAVSGLSLPFIANVANLAAFGLLWVLKFFFLDAMLFGPHHHGPEPDAADTNTDTDVDADTGAG